MLKLPQGTSEEVTELLEESDVPQGTSEDEDLEDFIIIANQLEEEQEINLEDDFVIVANQHGEEEHMHTKEERLEDAWSMLPDEQIKMVIKLAAPDCSPNCC